MKGLSLRFARTVKGDSGKDSYPDCNRAIDALRPNTDGEPPIGAYVWFHNERAGDVGIAVGNQKMLTLGPSGLPVVDRIVPVSYHGIYAGWSSGLRDRDYT